MSSDGQGDVQDVRIERFAEPQRPASVRNQPRRRPPLGRLHAYWHLLVTGVAARAGLTDRNGRSAYRRYGPLIAMRRRRRRLRR